MEPQKLVDFLGIMERLKETPRHSWMSGGRRESVAEHSWRLALMALLLKEEFPELDMDRVVALCLVHDWGEAVTGDIPGFYKTDDDEKQEADAVAGLLQQLPKETAARCGDLFEELAAGSTAEAKLCHALDKLECLIQHNEADIATWLPLEYEQNLIYGDAEAAEFEYTRVLKALIREKSEEKVKGVPPAGQGGPG